MMILVDAMGRPRWIGALVTDLDRTLTDPHLRVPAATITQLMRLRRAGLKVFLASGRRASELVQLPRLRACFDAYALETGGVVGPWQRLHPVAPTAAPLRRLSRWLDEQGVPHDGGQASISFYRSNVPLFESYGERARFDLHPNHDRVDVTMRGVTKATGLRRLARAFHVPLRAILAFGDGENDQGFLSAAGYAVAVGNAHPALKRLADEVLPGYGGAAVTAFLRTRLFPVPTIVREAASRTTTRPSTPRRHRAGPLRQRRGPA